MYKSLVLAPLIFALGVAPALAKPTVIAELGSAPLLGTSTSTAQMRKLVAQNEHLVSSAATRIGLTPAEYAQFRTAIASSRVAWVTVPRHLDAMTWQSGGTVYVLHDVVIPAGTNGWEVDVRAHDQVLALYMPAKCGNLSLVRKAAPVIAHRARPVRVAALKVTPPLAAVAPAFAAPAVVAAPPPPIAAAPVAAVPAPAAIPDDTPPAAPVAVASTEFPPVVAAAHHAPFFLAPLLLGLAALAGGGGSNSVGATPAGNCP